MWEYSSSFTFSASFDISIGYKTTESRKGILSAASRTEYSFFTEELSMSISTSLNAPRLTMVEVGKVSLQPAPIETQTNSMLDLNNVVFLPNSKSKEIRKKQRNNSMNYLRQY